MSRLLRPVLPALLGLTILVGAAMRIPEEARYKRPAELDRKPYPQRRIELDAAGVPGEAEYFGTLRFELYIGRSGKVDRVEAIESTMPARLRDTAIRRFSEASWEPGTRQGRPVRSILPVRIEFESPVPGLGAPAMRPET